MDMSRTPPARTGFVQQPQWFTCHYCYTQIFDVTPVHGDGPCPLKQAEHEIYTEMLEAQRDSYLRNGMAQLDASAMMAQVRKMMGIEDDEDNE